MSAEMVAPRRSSSAAGADPVKPRFIHLQNLPLIVSAVLIFLAVLRVYYFSGFNVSVAMQILTVLSWPSVLVGTILPLLINAAPLIAASTIGQWRALTGVADNLRSIAVWFVLLVLAPMAIREITILPAILSVVGAIAVVVWQSKTGRSFTLKKLMSTSRGRLTSLAAVVLFVLPTLSSPWQPFERVSYGSESSGEGVGDFYVIGEQAGRLLLVEASQKSTLWVDPASITGRAMCSIANLGSRPWWNASLSSIQQQKSPDPCDSLMEVTVKIPGVKIQSGPK